MNVFYISRDPKIAAQNMINKHVVKMPLESAQLLSTAHREYGDERECFYKRTHVNHPSAVWVRASTQHYNWVYEHMIALGEEYTKRYNRSHLTIEKMKEVLKNPPKGMPNNGFTPPPQCMPDIYKRDCTIAAYKAYYEFKKETIGEK